MFIKNIDKGVKTTAAKHMVHSSGHKKKNYMGWYKVKKSSTTTNTMKKL